MPKRVARNLTASEDGDKYAALLKACDNDHKCACINDAIFKHDSSWSTSGVGARSLGPCNMRPPKLWTPSVPFSVMNARHGEYAKFETLSDGITACVELWKRSYKDKSAYSTAKIWTGNADNPNYGSKPEEKAYISAIESCG